MQGIEWLALLPLLYLAGCTIVILLLISIRIAEKILTWVVLLFFAGGFVSFKIVPEKAHGAVTQLLVVDRFTLFFMGLLLAGTLIVFLLCIKYFRDQQLSQKEFYLILFLALMGASVMCASRHFVSFFLGLEVLSIPLYVMIGYPRNKKRALEAGIKYLILAGVASAFLLFGIALVYAARGTLGFAPGTGSQEAAGLTALSFAGFSLITVGFGFKMALVPFHFWAPDVYQGAPAPVAGFIATVSKAGVLAVLLRMFYEGQLFDYPGLKLLFAALAVASMFAGNWLALLQRNIKRILAYSSISHFGYILVGFLAAGEAGAEAALFYISAYVIMTLGAFGVVTALSGKGGDAEEIDAYRGLFWRRPWLGAIFAVMLLSLAGIPITVGFIGKFYLVAAGIRSTLWLLVISLVVSSVIGLYYYLRVVVAMFSVGEKKSQAEALPGAGKPNLSAGVVIVLAVLVLLVFWFGIYPTGFLPMVERAAESLMITGLN
jgi:NADH-quinone oxidoreductase subunit N